LDERKPPARGGRQTITEEELAMKRHGAWRNVGGNRVDLSKAEMRFQSLPRHREEGSLAQGQTISINRAPVLTLFATASEIVLRINTG